MLVTELNACSVALACLGSPHDERGHGSEVISLPATLPDYVQYNYMQRRIRMLPAMCLYLKIIMSPLRRHIFVCFMAKSAFWRGFSAPAL